MATIILETFFDSPDGKSAMEVALSLATTIKGAFKGTHYEITKRETRLGSTGKTTESIDLMLKVEGYTAKMLRNSFRRSHFCSSFTINGKRYNTARTVRMMWSVRKACNELVKKQITESEFYTEK